MLSNKNSNMIHMIRIEYNRYIIIHFNLSGLSDDYFFYDYLAKAFTNLCSEVLILFATPLTNLDGHLDWLLMFIRTKTNIAPEHRPGPKEESLHFPTVNFRGTWPAALFFGGKRGTWLCTLEDWKIIKCNLQITHLERKNMIFQTSMRTCSSR